MRSSACSAAVTHASMFSASFRHGITTDTIGTERSSASAAMGGFVWTTVLMVAIRRPSPRDAWVAGRTRGHAVITPGRAESGGDSRDDATAMRVCVVYDC